MLDFFWIIVWCNLITALLFLLAAFEQWSHLLLLIPNPSWSKVHPLSQRASSGSKTFQSVAKHYLWPQDLWLWLSKSGWSRSWSYWILDWIRGYTLVSRTRNHAEFQRIHKVYWHLVSGLHFGRNALQSAHFSWQALFRSTQSHFGHLRITF